MVKNVEAFLADVNSKYGWAVEEQARDLIVNNQSMEEQNPNALQLIFDVAVKRNEHDLAEELAEYLGIEYDGDPSDEEAVNQMMDDSVDDEDFINLVNSKFGWAVAQQAKAILQDSESLSEQNPTALQYISDLADMHNRPDIATLIDDYLDNPSGSGEY